MVYFETDSFNRFLDRFRQVGLTLSLQIATDNTVLHKIYMSTIRVSRIKVSMCRSADYSLKKLVASEDEEVKSKTFYPQNYFKVNLYYCGISWKPDGLKLRRVHRKKPIHLCKKSLL